MHAFMAGKRSYDSDSGSDDAGDNDVDIKRDDE
jgi:hypothetical protein